jgi:hypothetical protein
VENTHRCVGGVRTISMVRATPPFVRKWPSAVSLEALSHDLPPSVKRVGGGPVVYLRWSFLLSSTYFSLSSG